MRKRGFTLIELMVVIAIIGILSSIVVAGLDGARKSSRDGKRIADLKNIQVALALYYSDNGHYPCSIYTNAPTVPNCIPNFYQSTYLGETPRDPQGTYYFYSAFAPDVSNCNSAAVEFYHLGAAFENTNSNNLNSDADWVPTAPYADDCSQLASSANNTNQNFSGNTIGCTASGADSCYDVTSN